MQQRNPGNRRPTGTDGSDFSYRMVVDNRYTKVAKGKSTLSKILMIQAYMLFKAIIVGSLKHKGNLNFGLLTGAMAVVLLVGVLVMLFTYVNKEPLETLVLVSSSMIAISIIVGEIGRKRSRANLLRLYMAASSIGVIGSGASVIQSSTQLKVIHDLSNWETEKVALFRIACVFIGLLVQIFSITTTTSLIRNMSPPKRAS